MTNPINIVWFKRDLRINDHAPIIEAARHGIVLPLYIIEPELWKLPDSSRRHWHFIHDSLIDLQNAVAALGAKLVIRTGEVLDVMTCLLRETGGFTLWSHEETGNHWTYQRDIRVAQWCKAQELSWHEYPSNGVVRRLKSRDSWGATRNARMASSLITTPTRLTGFTTCLSEPLPEKNHLMFGSQNIGCVQSGGRKEALRTLDSFLNTRSRYYTVTISKPGVSARHCSRLSAHITYGTLSIREIEQATIAKMAFLSSRNDAEASFFHRNLSAFLSRLAWHCHFIQKLEQQPDIEFKCMHQAFEGMRESFFRDDFFDAWKTGNTGYPLIDACMRSLHANGWITFRMRAMLVSFASYHLWLDWRKTAPFLAQLFTDYEPGIHYSQFQMQSGVTGINVIRMYNPIKQSYDHDPTGQFIRRYVPELKPVSDVFIHEPWTMNKPPANYPKPIVEHDVAIKFARAEIAKRRQQDGFKENAQAVNKALGSRNRAPSKRRAHKKKDDRQLSFDWSNDDE